MDSDEKIEVTDQPSDSPECKQKSETKVESEKETPEENSVTVVTETKNTTGEQTDSSDREVEDKNSEQNGPSTETKCTEAIDESKAEEKDTEKNTEETVVENASGANEMEKPEENEIEKPSDIEQSSKDYEELEKKRPELGREPSVERTEDTINSNLEQLERKSAATPESSEPRPAKEISPDCAIIEAGLKNILFSPPGTTVENGMDFERRDGKVRIAKNKNRVAEKKKKGSENGEVTAKKPKTEEFGHRNNRSSSNYQKLAPLDKTGPSEERVKAMINEDVHPLKKKNSKFPMAAYFCRLCSYHCDNIDVCERHVRDAKHRQFKENRELDLLLKNLPSLSPVHIQALDGIIDKTVEQYALPSVVVDHRQTMVKQLEATIQEELSDVTLELYGSSVSGFGLKTSDINIDIILPSGRSASETLKAVYKLLLEKSNYVNVSSDFQAKIPSITFSDPISDVNVRLSLGNNPSRYTTQLLSTYCKLDSRVQKLGVALRYLAKICEIDQQVMGTMPAHSFPLMTIYFLQRTSPPVLPVLHEIHGEGRSRETVDCEGKEMPWFFDNMEKLSEHWQCKNEMSCGDLWVQMLRFYCSTFDLTRHVVCIRQTKTVDRDDKKWSRKKLAIEDPFSIRFNLTRSVSHTKNLDYIHDCLKHACKYFGIPQTKSGPLFKRVPLLVQAKAETLQTPEKHVVHDPLDVAMKDTRSYREMAHGVVDLAVEDMRKEFEKTDVTDVKDVETDHLDNVQRIELEQETEKEKDQNRGIEKKAQGVVLASFTGAYLDILDNKASNVLHASLQHDEVHNVIAPTGEGEKTDPADESVDEHVQKNSIDDADVSINESDLNDSAIDGNLDDSGIVAPVPKAKILGREPSEEEDEDLTEIMDAHILEENQEEPSIDETGDASKFVVDESSKQEGDYNKQLLEGLKSKDLIFSFDKSRLTDGRKPSIVCSVCQMEGHLKNDCPESILPEIKPLKPLSDDYKKRLEEVLCALPDEYMPSEKETSERKEILSELERFIRETYEKCNLCMFGSSCNQFGFKNSDLDICMTLEGVESPKTLNCIEIIEKVAQKLKTHKGLHSVNAITTAKVPIVKFKHRKSQIEADISLYNTLALHNTKMLDKYAALDPRVRTLGYITKVFAKVCDIGDASRGSLSSYAYILMVLYYLQRCDPPVVPCLQEMYEGEKPSRLIDGCDAWFFDDLDAVRETWEGFGKNTQTVAELWLGLLCFYVEKFDFKEHVISIRQMKPLTRFEKFWNGKSIAIEDPFDLNHNLGAGLSRKMNTFIMKAFINARHRFGSTNESDSLPNTNEAFRKYLFDPAALVEGLPPTDRGCRACGKIGHIARECPITQFRKERERRMAQERMGNRGPYRGDQRRDMRQGPPMDRRRGPPMPGPPFRPGMPFPPRGVYYNSYMPRPHMRGFPPFENRFPPGHPGARMRPPPPMPHGFQGQGRGMVMDPRHLSNLRSQNPDARFSPPGHYPMPPPPRPVRPPQAGYNARAPAPGPGGARSGQGAGSAGRPGRKAEEEAEKGRPTGERAANGDHDKRAESGDDEAKDDAARRHELDAQEKLERGIRAPPAGKTSVVIGKQDSRLDPNYDELRKKVVEGRAQQLKLHQQHLEELEKQKQENQATDTFNQGHHNYHSNREWHNRDQQQDQHHQHRPNHYNQNRPNYQQRDVYSPNKPHQNTNYNNSSRDKEFRMDGNKEKTPTSQGMFSSNHFSAETPSKENASVASMAPQWKKTHGPMLLQRPPGVTSGQLPLPVDLGLDKTDDKSDSQDSQPIPPFQIGLAAANQRMMFNKDSLVNQMLPMQQQPFRSPNRPPSPTSTSPLALLNQSISPSKRYNQQADPYRKRRSPSKDQPPRFQQGKRPDQFGQDVDAGQQQMVIQPMVNPQLQSMVHMQPTYLYYPQQPTNYQPRPEQKDDLFSRESMFPANVMSQALNTVQGHPMFPQHSQYSQDQARADDQEHKFDQYQYQQDTSQFGQQRDVYGQPHVYYNQNQMASAPIQNPVQDQGNFYQTTPQSQSAALTGTQIWFTSMAQPNYAQQETSSQQSMGNYNYRTQPSPSTALPDRPVPRNDPWIGGSSSSYQPSQVSDWLPQAQGGTAARLDQQQLSGFPMAPADANATQSQLFSVLDNNRTS